MSLAASHRVAFLGALVSLLLAGAAHAGVAKSRAKAPPNPKEQKAWINGKGMCVFPFAAEELPDNADAFADAMTRGYRKAIKLPDDSSVVTTEGGAYHKVDSL